MTNTEIDYIMDAIEMTAVQYEEWRKDYVYDPGCNEYAFSGLSAAERSIGMDWFNAPLR
jgi:hypothetical protein